MIIDGGLGVELLQRKFSMTTPLWSGEALLTRPDLLLEAHRAYIEAGARIVSTATYQVSHGALRALGYDELAINNIFARAVALVREAISGAACADASNYVVATSLGPYGATCGDRSEYTGKMHLATEELYAFHLERLQAVARTNPDVVLFETIPTAHEALVIARAAREAEIARVWISFTCADAKRTHGGDLLCESIAQLETFLNIEVLGVNCTAPSLMAALVREIRSQSAKPIAICPNLGQGGPIGGQMLDQEHAENEFFHYLPEWLALGVSHIGGCCGVGPATIARLTRWVKAPHAARTLGAPSAALRITPESGHQSQSW